MARTRTTINHSEIQSYLDGGHGVHELLLTAALDVQDSAISNGPIESGEYVDSIHIEEAHTDRLVIRVVADAPHAMVVEANTGNLSRALSAAG